MTSTIHHRYGRSLDDFQVGATYEHPWEVTLDEGLVALHTASFLDATPLYSSRPLARALGFRDRPLHPIVVLNLALSFSVHDISEQGIAHLGYRQICFPEAGYVGDTVTARSTVLSVRPSANDSSERGVVDVRTALCREDGRVLCAFERSVLMHGGRRANRPAAAQPTRQAIPVPPLGELERLPGELRGHIPQEPRSSLLPGYFEDFHAGQRIIHDVGRSVGQSEHMQLTTLGRNSHPLHFDAGYTQHSSFTGRRVVYGGLVFGWTVALSSRDVAGHALWELGFAQGAHAAAVSAGDTLYAASAVVETIDRGHPDAAAVHFKLVGLANLHGQEALARYGDALWDDELSKSRDKIKEKVFEIYRTLLIRKRPR